MGIQGKLPDKEEQVDCLEVMDKLSNHSRIKGKDCLDKLRSQQRQAEGCLVMRVLLGNSQVEEVFLGIVARLLDSQLQLLVEVVVVCLEMQEQRHYNNRSSQQQLQEGFLAEQEDRLKQSQLVLCFVGHNLHHQEELVYLERVSLLLNLQL